LKNTRSKLAVSVSSIRLKKLKLFLARIVGQGSIMNKIAIE